MSNKKMFIGIMLIILGIILGLTSLNILDGLYVLYIVGFGFIIGYFTISRRIGWIIPGCIIIAVALFATIQSLFPDFDDYYFLIMLGFSFFLIFLIHTMHYTSKGWGRKYWPLIPGWCLVLMGALLLILEKYNISIAEKYLSLISPAVLVIIGIALILKNTIRNRITK